MTPYIICHMMQSLDGRVACDMVDKISGDEYYTALDTLECQAHVEGKHSYQIHRCGFEEFNLHYSYCFVTKGLNGSASARAQR